MSALGTINGLNRLLSVIGQGYAVWFLVNRPRPGITAEKEFGGSWKYLTIWTASIHLAFFSLCILCEIFSYLKFKTDNFSFRGLIYHALVVPLGINVFVSFWSLYASDPELIYPESVSKTIPVWVNHMVHSAILPALMIEGAAYYHPLPTRKEGLGLLWLVNVSYGLWVAYIGFTKGHWVYPFLNQLAMPLRIGFFILSTLICTVYYLVAEKVHLFIWRKKIKDE